MNTLLYVWFFTLKKRKKNPKVYVDFFVMWNFSILFYSKKLNRMVHRIGGNYNILSLKLHEHRSYLYLILLKLEVQISQCLICCKGNWIMLFI